jgi:hypothetical protein
MKLICAALLAGLAWAAAAQQPPANHDQGKNPKPAIDYNALRDRYFPFHAGQVRTYTYRGEEELGSDIHRYAATYTETVIAVRDITPEIRVVQLEIRGSRGADHTRCGVGPMEGDPDPDEPVVDPSSFWYIFSGGLVYTRCAQEDLDKLVHWLRGHPPRDEDRYSDNCRPWCNDYVLPLKVGRSWGNPSWKERPPGQTRWEFFVAARETVSVPAGTFKDCFQIIYNTNPGDLKTWICPGAGLVADESTHHGSLMHYRIELAGMTTKQPEK